MGVGRLRRTLLLAGLVALGALLVVVVRAPPRSTGPSAVRGHRVFALRPHAVHGVDLSLGERRLSARRSERGWAIDGRAASAASAAALDDLLDTLLALRAIDVFRGRDGSSYGLDRPGGSIDLHTRRGPRRLLLGEMNAAGSALYARRVGDPRVLQVGTLLLSEIERVFYTRDGPRAAG